MTDQGSVIVLASGSRYRARLLADAGIAAVVDPPDVDERRHDDRLAVLGPERLALELAELKARDVAPRHPGRVIVAADQVGVLQPPRGPAVLLTKQPSFRGAVAQLSSLSATTHRLVNGLVVLAPDGALHTGLDVQVVTMRSFDRAEAEAYVRRFEPFDTAGSYRLEDQADMEPGSGFVTSIEGEDPTGVVGLPVPLLRRLLARLSP